VCAIGASRNTRRTTIEASSVDVDVDFVVDVELIVELVAVNVRKAEREKESNFGV
jgi:hypothetical protein